MTKQLPPLLAPFRGETRYIPAAGLHVSVGIQALIDKHGADWLPALVHVTHPLESANFYCLFCHYSKPEIWLVAKLENGGHFIRLCAPYSTPETRIIDDGEFMALHALFHRLHSPAFTRIYQHGNLLLTQEESPLLRV